VEEDWKRSPNPADKRSHHKRGATSLSRSSPPAAGLGLGLELDHEHAGELGRAGDRRGPGESAAELELDQTLRHFEMTVDLYLAPLGAWSKCIRLPPRNLAHLMGS